MILRTLLRTWDFMIVFDIFYIYKIIITLL